MSFDSQWFEIPTPPSGYNTAKLGVLYSETDAGPVAMLIGERDRPDHLQGTLFLPICPETVAALRAAADIVEWQVPILKGERET